MSRTDTDNSHNDGSDNPRNGPPQLRHEIWCHSSRGEFLRPVGAGAGDNGNGVQAETNSSASTCTCECTEMDPDTSIDEASSHADAVAHANHQKPSSPAGSGDQSEPQLQGPKTGTPPANGVSGVDGSPNSSLVLTGSPSSLIVELGSGENSLVSSEILTNTHYVSSGEDMVGIGDQFLVLADDHDDNQLAFVYIDPMNDPDFLQFILFDNTANG